MKKLIYGLSLAFLLIGGGAAYASQTTTHTITIEDNTLALTIIENDVVSTMKQNTSSAISSWDNIAIQNNGSLDGYVYAQLGTAPAGLTYTADIPSQANYLYVVVNTSNSESFPLTETSIPLNIMIPSNTNTNFDVGFTFGPNTDVGTYQIPITWVMKTS